MELVDRYLQAVRFWLPKKQQQDIIDELRDDITSQIEDQESAVSRPLSEDELAVILKQTGHPMLVASRYRPQQQYLIGPVLFPVYWFILKMMTFGYLAPWLLVALVWTVFFPAHRGIDYIGRLWGLFWSIAFYLFSAITITFLVIERIQVKRKSLENWNPHKLPPARKPAERVSRPASVAGLVVNVIMLGWWLSIPQYAHFIWDPLTGFLALAVPLRPYYIPVALLMLAVMVQQIINLFRPQWTWLPPAVQLVTTAIALGMVESLARRYPYIALVDAAKDAVRHGHTAEIINWVILWSLIGTAFGMCIALLVYALQCIQLLRRRLRFPSDGPRRPISQML